MNINPNCFSLCFTPTTGPPKMPNDIGTENSTAKKIIKGGKIQLSRSKEGRVPVSSGKTSSVSRKKGGVRALSGGGIRLIPDQVTDNMSQLKKIKFLEI